MGEASEWARIQAEGVKRTLTGDQHVALVAWLERQAHGGPLPPDGEWGPRWWLVEGWSKPQTTGRLSNRLRIRVILTRTEDWLEIGTKRTLVWDNTIRWRRIK